MIMFVNYLDSVDDGFIVGVVCDLRYVDSGPYVDIFGVDCVVVAIVVVVVAVVDSRFIGVVGGAGRRVVPVGCCGNR